MVKLALSRLLRHGLRCVLGLSVSACSLVLGIEDAHVDPTLAEVGSLAVEPDASTPLSSGPTSSQGAVCKPFDNATRLTRLIDGALAPLPGGN